MIMHSEISAFDIFQFVQIDEFMEEDDGENQEKTKKKEMGKGTKKCGNNKNVDNSTSQEDDGIEKDTR